MKSASAVAAVALLVSGAAAQQLTINTPNSLVECLPQLLSWSGGQPPYFLTVQPGNQPGAPPIEDLGQQSGTSLTWNVNIAEGTSVGFALRDSTGNIAQSSPLTIQKGSNSSCVGQAASTSAGSAGTSPTSGGSSGGSGSTAGQTSSGSSPSQTRPSSSSGTPSGSGSAAPANNSNAASSNTQFGAAGLVGAALLALLS